MNWYDCFLHLLHLFLCAMSPALIRLLFTLWMPLVTHISELRLKKRLCSVLKSSETRACRTVVDRKLDKPTTPPASNSNTHMACLMISILTGCQYVSYYSKVQDWNWEFRVACFQISYQSCFSQKWVRTRCLKLSLYIFISSKISLQCMSPWTNGSASTSWQALDFNTFWHWLILLTVLHTM